jgi:hypothetical protein
MLNHQPYARSLPPKSLRQRFLSSSSGVLSELKQLLVGSRAPIEPATGAQIAQMLRAIREGASTHALDRIAHFIASIEMYLASSEAYGPGGELRNFVLGAQIERLQRYFEEASALGDTSSGAG